MRDFIKAWFTNEPEEVTVYWTCKNGKYVSAIKANGGFNVICSDGNCADMKSKTTRLLKQLGSAKLVWSKR